MFNYTQELQRYYASAPGGLMQAQCIRLMHPLFTQDWNLTNWIDDFEGELDGVTYAWETVPFICAQPNRESGIVQSMEVRLDNCSPEISIELEKAVQESTAPVVFVYTEYLFNRKEQLIGPAQLDPPIILSVRSFTVTMTEVAFSATHDDVVNRAFPFQVFRTDSFPGLV